MQRSYQLNYQDQISAARELAGLADLHRRSSTGGVGNMSSLLPQEPRIPPLQTRLVTVPPRAPAPHTTNLVQVRPLKDAKKTFPVILFDILENPEYREILTWLPGGKAFIVLDKERFVTEILPTYFKACLFPSFARKLQRWQFVRVPRGRYSGAFYHKLFRRNSKCLCELMSCDDKAPQDLSSLFAKVRSWKQESSRRQGSVDECRRLQSTLARGHRNLHNSQALSQAAVTNPFSHQHGRTNTSSSSSSHSPSNLDSSHLRAMNVLNGRASAPQSYPTHITNCEQTNQQSKMDQIGLCAVNGSGSELLTGYRASAA
jgi:hypothetical protein